MLLEVGYALAKGKKIILAIKKDVYTYFSSNWDRSRIEMVEQFKIMLLNRANKVLGIFEVSTGG